jgi:hypothetical protein
VEAAVSRSSQTKRTAYIGGCVFCAWFFGYGLRKPWSAASYRHPAGVTVLGLAPKDAISMGQTVGYMSGKLMASTAVPRLSRSARLTLLLGLVVATVVPLFFFGHAESAEWQVFWRCATGWPLGWFDGPVYLSLEGRYGPRIKPGSLFCLLAMTSTWSRFASWTARRSAPEVLCSCISGAFIVGSGAAKSAGAFLLST